MILSRPALAVVLSMWIAAAAAHSQSPSAQPVPGLQPWTPPTNTWTAPVPTSPAPSAHLVNVACCAFTDSASGGNQTFVTPGTTVQWVRLDPGPYTVTSGAGSWDPQMGSAFNGFLVPPSSAFSHTFTAPGAFPYFCAFHESVGMNGVVNVVYPATAYLLGDGCVGSNGAELTIGNNGFPELGNASFSLTVGGGVPGSIAYVFLASSFAASPWPVAPGCLAQLDLASLTAFILAGLTPTGPRTLDAAGSTTVGFPIPPSPWLAGATVAAQGLAFDPPAPGGVVLSNGLMLVLGA
jgi:hypothetical protein